MKTRHIAVGMKAKYYSKDPEQRDIIKDGVVTGVFNDGTEECVVVEDDYYNKLETEPHPVEIVPVKRILAVTKGYTNFEVEGPGVPLARGDRVTFRAFGSQDRIETGTITNIVDTISYKVEFAPSRYQIVPREYVKTYLSRKGWRRVHRTRDLTTENQVLIPGTWIEYEGLYGTPETYSGQIVGIEGDQMYIVNSIEYLYHISDILEVLSHQ